MVCFALQEYGEGPLKIINLKHDGGTIFPLGINTTNASKYAVYTINLVDEKDQYYLVHYNKNHDTLSCSKSQHQDHKSCEHTRMVAQNLKSSGVNLNFNKKVKRAQRKRQIWSMDEGLNLANDLENLNLDDGINDFIPNPRFMQTPDDVHLAKGDKTDESFNSERKSLIEDYNAYRYHAPDYGQIASL